ncbi:helix-turn-helix domain-containing protein [Citrobacter freundii]|uniref:helix-turn-helix domain-containing protein n=1 Tax=Citrobacter freundii TaxID=546 RepID=UPI001905CD15|nr:AraC family transcriptional regulator [Citrobacter freundii]MBJ9289719.1 helix-turn-helix transcriptional regulator [Citrobacter freundii]MDT7311180.1 AraC family transcriptional regulator [Citrobacter freundii]
MKANSIIHIKSIQAWMEKNLENDISLSMIAARSGYCITHIQNKFKMQTGSTIKEYIKKRRMFRAALYLHFSKIPIRDISFKLRFKSLSTFSRAFHLFYLKSPVDYRKTNILYFMDSIEHGSFLDSDKTPPCVSFFDNMEFSFAGLQFHYHIRIVDFDRPHINHRIRFKKYFFELFDDVPPLYYTATRYLPSDISPESVCVIYTIGIDVNEIDRCKKISLTQFEFTLNQGAMFESTGTFYNPYEVVLKANVRLSEFHYGKINDWEFEKYEIKEDGKMEYVYYAPVKKIDFCHYNINLDI